MLAALHHERTAPRRAVGVATGVVLAVAAIVVALLGAPVAWWLLTVCGVLCSAVLIVAIIERRVLEPLPILAATLVVRFFARPLDLFLRSPDLLSWYPPSNSVDSLLRLDNQEVSYFSTRLLQEPLQPALTRTIGACALFIALVIAGSLLPYGRRGAARLARVAGPRRMNPRAAVAICVAIGLIGQIAVIVKTGGIAAVADSQAKQRALAAGFVISTLAGFMIVAVVVWFAFMLPQSSRQWAVFGLLTAEACVYYALLGSRTRVLTIALVLVVVWNYAYRPLRLRTLVVAALLGFAFAAAAFAVRQATVDRPYVEALSEAPRYVVDPRGVLNDLTEFDQLFYVTSSMGHALHYRYGGWLLDGVRSYVPGFIDAGKPESGDIVVREKVFGNTVGAGRPPTIVGDFFYDFGFTGIAVGAMLLGILVRALVGLVATRDTAGQPHRAALYGLAIVVLHGAVTGTYSLVLGDLLTLLAPYLLAVYAFGRVGLNAPLLGRGRPPTPS